jgi:hypothetical protein
MDFAVSHKITIRLDSFPKRREQRVISDSRVDMSHQTEFFQAATSRRLFPLHRAGLSRNDLRKELEGAKGQKSFRHELMERKMDRDMKGVNPLSG